MSMKRTRDLQKGVTDAQQQRYTTGSTRSLVTDASPEIITTAHRNRASRAP